MVEIESLLENMLGISMSRRTISHYHRQRRLVGPANGDDFASAVLLECWEARCAQSQMTDDDVFRAIDRVGHRLRRELRRRSRGVLIEYIKTRPHTAADVTDDATLREALSSRSPFDLKVVESHFLDGESVDSLALRLGVAKRTLYRRIADIKRVLRERLCQ